MGKLFRYRRPSINTLLGITKAKKRIKKDLGITAAMKPFRWFGNQERRLKRKLGYYSPLGQLLRLGLPTVLGIKLSKSARRAPVVEPEPELAPLRRKSSPLVPALIFFPVFATLAVAGLMGGCNDSTSQRQTTVAQRSLPTQQQTMMPARLVETASIPVPNDSRPAVQQEAPPPVEQPIFVDEYLEQVKAASREWTDDTGKFHTTAVLLDVVAGIARLQRPEKVVSVPVARLSDNDFAYLATVGVKEAPRVITGKVVSVADGDTITILVEGNKQVKIRLNGIDAPERGQAFGTAAREALSGKIFQKTVRIEWRELDKYGRTIGDLYVDDRLINKEMVEEGFAWHYKRFSKSFELADAESNARDNHRGLWADKNPETPWQFRATEEERRKVAAAKPKPEPKAKPEPPPRRETPPPTVDRNPYGETVTGHTATGIPTYTGPRGGQYHYSKNGNKVYERKKK